MEFIQELLKVDWAAIGVQLLAIYGALKALAAITPWTQDDKIVSAIEVPLKKLGLID